MIIKSRKGQDIKILLTTAKEVYEFESVIQQHSEYSDSIDVYFEEQRTADFYPAFNVKVEIIGHNVEYEILCFDVAKMYGKRDEQAKQVFLNYLKINLQN